MFGIQELDDLVCQELSPHDLAQCAQVSKKWHSAVVPHLWRDLTWLWEYGESPQGFVQVVVEDYLEEQQRQNLQGNGHTMEQPTPPSSHMSALSKYGHCIRLLPNPYRLEDAFRNYPTGESEATVSRLLLHLCRRCSSGEVQVKYFPVSRPHLDLAPDDPQRIVMDFTLPRVRHLSIQGRLPKSISKVTRVLEQCSFPLRRLDFQGHPIDTSGMFGLEEEPTEHGVKHWTSFKELALDCWSDNIFWQWFFKRCRQVEKLELQGILRTAQVLAQAMLNHMPQLVEIKLGKGGHFSMADDNVAALLTGSTKGWRRVTLGIQTGPGRAVMGAMEKHFSTLETLEIDERRGFGSENAVHFLRSCPHLQSFANTDPFSRLDLKVFTDRDPDTGSLWPWKCEQTLRVLRLFVRGIPRSMELQGGAYIGEVSEIHSGFYDRLARLTQLETLELRDHVCWMNAEYLELSLLSGLHKLSGLKSMKGLCVTGLSTKIGIKEVQWMVENWPRLRLIKGLDGNEGNECNEEAVQWLRKNHGEIVV